MHRKGFGIEKTALWGERMEIDSIKYGVKRLFDYLENEFEIINKKLDKINNKKSRF